LNKSDADYVKQSNIESLFLSKIQTDKVVISISINDKSFGHLLFWQFRKAYW